MAADAGGVHAFLIWVNLGSEPILDIASTLEELDAMDTIWSHAILLFMNAKAIDVQPHTLLSIQLQTVFPSTNYNT